MSEPSTSAGAIVAPVATGLFYHDVLATLTEGVKALRRILGASRG